MTINNGSPQQPERPQTQGGPPSRGPFGIPTRWLIIGGGAGGILLIVIVVLAVILSGAIGGGNPQPRPAFDLVPDDVQVLRRSNVRDILDDDFLADALYPNGVLGAEHLGIDDDKMDRLVTASWETGAVDVIRGNSSLEQWEMGTKDLRRRMILAPTPRERERWYAMLLLAQGLTAAATAEALERDPHTIGRWAAAFGEGGPRVLIFKQTGGSPRP